MARAIDQAMTTLIKTIKGEYCTGTVR